MGFDPVTMGIAQAGVSVGAKLLDKRSSKKSRRKANKREMARTDASLANMLASYQQRQDDITGGYSQAGQIDQDASNRAMQMRGSTFMPRMQAYQGGNMMAQQANLDSIPAMRAALLGGRIPQMRQAQSMPINEAALAGLINPQAQQFPQQQQFKQMQPFNQNIRR